MKTLAIVAAAVVANKLLFGLFVSAGISTAPDLPPANYREIWHWGVSWARQFTNLWRPPRPASLSEIPPAQPKP